MKPFILEISSLSHDGQYDKDRIMLHAAFSLLVSFVEEEWMGDETSFEQFEVEMRKFNDEIRNGVHEGTTNSDIEHANANDVILDLYKWWKNDYPRELQNRSQSVENMKSFDLKEQEMLEKLVKYRGAMWT